MEQHNRRSPGEGTIRQMANGLYQVRGTLEGKRRSFYGKTRKEALGKLREAQNQAAQGRLVGTKSQRLDTYLESWLQEMEHRVRPLTLRNYRLNVNRLVPYLGNVRLDQLKPAQIQAAYAKLLATGLSKRSVQQSATVLHKALEDALDLDLLPRNVAERAKAPRPGKNERPTLSADELAHLFEGTKGDRFHALWVVLGTTGLRLGEALGLQWSDVDLGKATLTVRRPLQRVTGKGLQRVEPKSETSRRTVELTEIAMHALRTQKECQAVDRAQAANLWRDQNLVFASEVGTGLEQGRVWKHWQKTLTKLDLPAIHMHDLRHTVASLSLKAGVHPRVVQEMLGHSTITLTLGTYSHVAATLQREAVDRLEAILRERMAP